MSTCKPITATALSIALGLLACKKSPEQAQREAQEARQEAELTQAVIHDNAQAEADKAQREVDKKSAAAADTLAAARMDLSKFGDEKLTKLEQRAAVLRGRISSMASAKPGRAEFERKLDEVDAQLTRARSTLAGANGAADPATLAATRARVESDVKTIDGLISNLANEAM